MAFLMHGVQDDEVNVPFCVRAGSTRKSFWNDAERLTWDRDGIFGDILFCNFCYRKPFAFRIFSSVISLPGTALPQPNTRLPMQQEYTQT